MYKGDISINKFGSGSFVLVVDYDLLFSVSIKYKFPFNIKRNYNFTDYNRKIVKLIKKLNGEFDTILIVIPKKNYSYEEKVINKILMLPYSVLHFDNENDYKLWLNIVEPASHLATRERRYYNKEVSKYVAPNEI